MNPFIQSWTQSSYNATDAIISPLSSPSFLKFTFLFPDATILNSAVIGPDSRPCFYVTTDSCTSGISLIQNANSQNIAIIEWRQHPVVEILEVIPKRHSSQWLKLSSDKRYRIMNAQRQGFKILPRDDYIGLYTITANPQLVGRISQSSEGITLEVRTEAAQIGLIDAFVTSTVLLMCGRNID
ncbi:hypothetical protein C8J57DRAFT_726515 [Mycena rebaudengoi]|nr:hypothetical protein C8J57DRAFT_726515 [Mycena rebaudengoi]